ncbi:MAG: hypothetical protein JW993_05700 [Sedimentisphaerales bacterium]|nr:hypothetical protein [Sedimentisphaerales bacterium]
MKKLALVTLVISLALSTVSFAGLTREIWDNTPTGNMDEAWAVINGETPPTSVDVISRPDIGDRGVDNFVTHLTGYLVVPEDGDYIFRTTSDDDSQLLLDGVVVASVTGWTGAREWTSGSSTPSEPMTLAAGQVLELEAAMREGTGGDNFAIGWLRPGRTSFSVLSSSATYPDAAALSIPAAPVPADGATGIESGMLSWAAPLLGENPVYNVYLGTDPNALALVSEGQTETSYDAGALKADLDFSTTYYWQVTVNGEGNVWSFTTAGPVVVTGATGDAQPVGAAAQVSVEAYSPVGADLSYEWHRLNFSPIPGLVIPDAAIPGAESAVYAIEALTAADQGEYYCIVSSEDGSVASPVVFLDAQTGLIHQWTFNETPDGVTIPDVVGGADGTLMNVTGNAVIANGQATTGNDGSQGSNSNNGDYVDLPNGIVSVLTQMTIECWTTWTNDSQVWARVYDFGTSDQGEDRSPSASSGGSVYNFYVTPRNGGGNTILEYRYGGTAPAITPITNGRLPLNEEVMVAQVTDDKANRVKLYINGVAVGGFEPLFPLQAMTDNNNWLGRSQWPDPLYVGSWNEFRIYDTALSAEQIAADYLAGPDQLGVVPERSTAAKVAGDLNRDGVYDFLDAAIAADTFLTRLLEEQAAD